MMTNLLNGAHVANKLFSTIARLRLLLVMFVALTVSANVWGAEAEFAPNNFSGQGTSGTGSPISATVNGVTFACDEGYGTTQFRCYSGSTITISSSNTITAISFTFSGSYNGGLETSYTNLSTNSWEKELSSQARITACVVTYETAAATKYTVTWDVNGDQSVTTQVTEGSKPTFPATPSSCDATSTTFYGWATATWDGKINDVSAKTIYTSANDMPAVNGAVTYYAVFAENSGGASFDGTTGGNFKIYAIVNGTKYYAQGTGSKISSTTEESDATEYTFTKTNTSFTIKTGTSYITYSSSTNLGTSTTPYDWNISEGKNGSWRIASVASTTRGIVFRAGSSYNQFGGYALSNASDGSTEYFDVEIGSSPSFSNFITSCTTQPSRCVTQKMRG